MSVSDSNTIDAMAFDEELNKVILLLSDHLDWDDEYEHLELLKANINAYFTFIQNGTANDKYGGKYQDT